MPSENLVPDILPDLGPPPEKVTSPIISLRQVTRIYRQGRERVVGVEGVSLEVQKGEILGVIGYSGAGKSTLIRLLNGLEKADAGEIRVNGTRLDGLSERGLRKIRPGIGMIFQHFNLLWSRTVRGNIALAMKIAGRPAAQIHARTEELIRLVGLDGKGDAYPAQLSGGQKQRVGIARALANAPDVLLCDEATSALDPETTDQILDLLSQINRELGLTVVLITHEMHVVRRIASRIAVMEAGRVVESGTVEALLSNPQQAVTRRFLGQLQEAGGAEVLTFEAPRLPDLAAVIAGLSASVTLLAARPDGAGLSRFDLRIDGADAAKARARLVAQGLGVSVKEHADA